MSEHKHISPETERRYPLVDLVRRYPDQDLLALFTLHATGVNVTRKKQSELYGEVVNPESAPYNSTFFEYSRYGIYEWSEAPVINQQEKEVIDTLHQKQFSERNVLIQEVLQSHPSIARMHEAILTVFSPSGIGRSASTHTHNEAVRMAQTDMRAKYGGNFEQFLFMHSGMKREYLQKIQWYEELENPQVVTGLRYKTAEEAHNLLEQTLQQEIPSFIMDLVKSGDKAYVIPIADFSKKNPSMYSLSPEQVRNLRIHFHDYSLHHRSSLESKISGSLGNTTVIFSLNKSVLSNVIKGNDIRGPDTFQFIDNLFGSLIDLIDNDKSINKEKVVLYKQLLARQKLIYKINDLRYELINTAHFLGRNPTAILCNDREFLIELDDTSAEPTPTLKKPLSAYIDEGQEWYKQEKEAHPLDRNHMFDYIRWNVLLHADERQPFPGFPLPSKEGGRGGLFSLRNLWRDFIQSSEVMSHYAAEPMKKLATFSSILLEEIKQYVKPRFVISGHPIKHMKQLAAINELSTYPQKKGLNFQPYILPEEPYVDDTIYINSHIPVAPVFDRDGSLAVGLFTPEYAEVALVQISTLDKENLLIDEHYHLEYETTTGHYRAVLTEKGKEKLYHTKSNVLQYTLGINPYKLVENTPPLVPSADVHTTEELTSFSNELAQLGFTKMAERLDKLVQKHKISPGPLTTADIETALRKGARYGFAGIHEKETLDSSASSQNIWEHIPDPNARGEVVLQCAHAALIFSELLNRMYSDADVHPSFMLTTINIGLGKVFAGIPHADTRGRIHDVRIRHDSTPTTTLRSYIETFITGKESEVQIPLDTRLHVIATTLSREFSKAVISALPSREVIVNGQKVRRVQEPIPPAVTSVGSLLRELRENSTNIAQNPTERQRICEELVKNRHIWSLVHKNIEKQQLLRQQFINLFGDAISLAPQVVRMIEEVLDILK
jgi:hypothetical protein